MCTCNHQDILSGESVSLTVCLTISLLPLCLNTFIFCLNVGPFDCLSFCFSIYLCLLVSVFLSYCLLACLTKLLAFLNSTVCRCIRLVVFVGLSGCLLIYLSVQLSIWLLSPRVYACLLPPLSVCLPFSPSVYLLVCLSFFLSVYLPVCVSVCLPAYLCNASNSIWICYH